MECIECCEVYTVESCHTADSSALLPHCDRSEISTPVVHCSISLIFFLFSKRTTIAHSLAPGTSMSQTPPMKDAHPLNGGDHTPELAS